MKVQQLKKQRFHYKVESNMYFVPTEELNSRGNAKCIPITIRKLLLFSEVDGFWPKLMRINRYIRKGEIRYTVSKLKEIEVDVWSINKPPKEPTWVKMENFSEFECLQWLDRVLGSESAEAIHELTSKKPEKE